MIFSRSCGVSRASVAGSDLRRRPAAQFPGRWALQSFRHRGAHHRLQSPKPSTALRSLGRAGVTLACRLFAAHRLSRMSDATALHLPGTSVLAKFRQPVQSHPMNTMNISLPDSLKSFVDEQVNQRSYGTASEYVRELIRKDQERQRLRGLLLDGAASSPAEPVNASHFDALRDRVNRRARG